MEKYLKQFLRLFGDIRLTIFLLFKLFFLILFATFSQVDLGIFEANKRYFTSWFVFMGAIPIYLGGYFIGLLLLINLMASHATKFRFSKSYMGIFLIHFGLILLIIGSGITSFLGEEMQISIQEGESRNYLEYPSEFELVIIDTSDTTFDRIHSFELSDLESAVPFNQVTLQYLTYAPNAIINQRGIENPKFNQLGQSFKLISMPKTYKMSERNIPGLTLMVQFKNQTDYYLLWGGSAIYQTLMIDNQQFLIKIRPKRRYLDFSIYLHDFIRNTYEKSDTARQFMSKVSLITPNGTVPFDIQMNEPLRYNGYTFFQSSFTDDEQTSVFQVVKNPSWLVPYISSIIIIIGLFVQMMTSMRKGRS
ncbi:hypothetical protein DID73_01610 [Candidatus Marinamargulisbacteria bacterium SCGC AG-343-K17]|nr:hypothetical protein DID73_01610 [Candidatus Marinamargulisbacteria bacterium SCGC AG-343-K17]